MKFEKLPRINTPQGGWNNWPPPHLKNYYYSPPFDMAGVWKSTEEGIIQRIEQVGLRTTIAAEGIIHDMYSDGTLDGAVKDVLESDKKTEIVVIASYEHVKISSGEIKFVHLLMIQSPFIITDKKLGVKRYIENGILFFEYPTQKTIAKIVSGADINEDDIELEVIKCTKILDADADPKLIPPPL